MLTYSTAGESHGSAIFALIEGLPAGLPVDRDPIAAMLARRRGGFGRSARQQLETDAIEIPAGLKGGITLGSPLLIRIANKDASIEDKPVVTAPRPGHADLAGMMKYGVTDAGRILERASARETAARTAAGAVAAQLLARFGVEISSRVVQIGDATTEEKMKVVVEAARDRGDTLGGAFAIASTPLPPGLGGFASWEQRLEGRLARAVCSIQAVKGVEFGLGFAYATTPGSQAHDEIDYAGGGFTRSTNRAGGIEGGMTNGQPLHLRAVMKPLSTQGKPLKTVDVATKQVAEAARPRSDVCAVHAASVVAEAVVAFEVAAAMREKFGGDSLMEMKRNHDGYLKQIAEM